MGVRALGIRLELNNYEKMKMQIFKKKETIKFFFKILNINN